MASTAMAVRITNMTTGELLFYDNFEAAPNGVSSAPYPDLSGDYDPVALTGVWSISTSTPFTPEPVESDIQVTNSTTAPDPGQFQGSNYLRVDRTDILPAAFATFTPQSTVGHVIRFETMAALGSTNNNVGAFIFVDSLNQNINLTQIDDDGTVDNRNSANQTSSIPGLSHTKGQWSHYIIDYQIGSSTYQVTVDGVSSGQLPINAVSVPADIMAMRFNAASRAGLTGGNPTIATMYADSILGHGLKLEVNQTTGSMTILNNSGETIDIDFYEIQSLTPNALVNNPLSGMNAYDPGKWTELASNTTHITEATVGQSTAIPNGASIPLGNLYNTSTAAENLTFNIHIAGTSEVLLVPGFDIQYVTGSVNNADFDNDGDVDGSDFLAWQAGNGGSGGLLQGDANGDNMVNAADLAIWKSQYGSGNGGGSLAGGAVPEPSSLLLFTAAALAIAVAAMRRKV